MTVAEAELSPAGREERSGRSLLLSLRPRFAEAILDGTKTVELRRTRVHVQPGTLVLLYSATPVKAILGTARVRDIETLTPCLLWSRVEGSCSVTANEYDDYFHKAPLAHGIHLSDAQRLTRPIPLAALRARLGVEPAQSFRYLTEQQSSRLLEANAADTDTASTDAGFRELLHNAQELLAALVRVGPEIVRHALLPPGATNGRTRSRRG